MPREGGASSKHESLCKISNLSVTGSPACAAMTQRVCPALIRRRQPPHRELDAPVGQFAPAFDLGHVGGPGKAAEHLARLGACVLARECEGLAPERVGLAFAQRLGGASCDVGGSSALAH